ncbi:MAG: peptidoglycan DD-metalloendopeptidase family protein, partial [Mogibacterium sp.]|nr:peptidoglycan DD-metalloendopeptidase family protein [Mogibacterium sp.]
ARYLAEKKLKPGDATFVEPEELIEKSKTEAEKAEPAPAVSAAEKEENAPETKPSAAPEKSSGEMTKEEKMKALALEYARMLKEKGLKPGEADVTEPEAPAKESKTEEPVKAEKKSKPTEEEKKEKAKEKAKQKKTAKQAKRKAKAKATAEKKKASGAAEAPLFRTGRFESMLASMLDTHDRMQDRRDESFGKAGRDFVRGAHKMAATYTHSRRQIGIGLLVVGVLAAAILILFDQFTVYEYAYNGKVLGYVKEQEEVTEVLDIAGEKLSQNNGGTAPVEFVANQNVTFNPVDGRGKSTDDMDTAVNKLIYMTDIETEAYAVYDGDRIVAIVKDQSSAEKLLADALATLSRPDSGMELVSAEFENELSISPINVLLSSVQSSNKALKLMTKGGEMETLHIVEEGETVESIAEKFGVDTVNVYTYGEKTEDEEVDEEEAAEEEGSEDSSSGDSSSEEESSEEDSADNESSKESDKETAEKVSVETKVTSADENAAGGEIMQGDMVCIKSTVEPVSVRMVEEGKMKEVIEYETIKKKSGEYYQGDTRIEQEGKNGVQIFEGRLTKVAGEVVDRKEVSTSVIRDKQDKIILIGTKERPKTAPTGTYAMPLEYYTVTSEFGQRWGRLHAGIDLAEPTGTTIYASDGGTVIRASYFGGYGNCVEIDHENGRVTRYGHCSAILVSEGDKVYQGQPIALVGSTGNSTGPHLHFEIILDGVQHNPREFVDF